MEKCQGVRPLVRVGDVSLSLSLSLPLFPRRASLVAGIPYRPLKAAALSPERRRHRRLPFFFFCPHPRDDEGE